jgi:hypothetical protein
MKPSMATIASLPVTETNHVSKMKVPWWQNVLRRIEATILDFFQLGFMRILYVLFKS